MAKTQEMHDVQSFLKSALAYVDDTYEHTGRVSLCVAICRDYQGDPVELECRASFSYGDGVEGADLLSCIDELARRKGWDKANKYVPQLTDQTVDADLETEEV